MRKIKTKSPPRSENLRKATGPCAHALHRDSKMTLTDLTEIHPMEKRKCPRFPVMLPTLFFGERAGGGMVVDVSLEGCRIQSAVPMQKGDYVQIRIDLIGDTLTGDLAVVRWSRKNEFGVELIRMAPDQQTRLHGFLQLFSTPPLRPAPGV